MFQWIVTHNWHRHILISRWTSTNRGFKSFDNARWLLESLFARKPYFKSTRRLYAQLRFRCWVSRRLFEEALVIGWEILIQSRRISKARESMIDGFENKRFIVAFCRRFLFSFSLRKLINKVKVYLKNASRSFPVCFLKFFERDQTLTPNNENFYWLFSIAEMRHGRRTNEGMINELLVVV